MPAFYASLLFLGAGWNLMFVAGSTLLTHSYRASERAKTQGAAEFIRCASAALATLAAGPLHGHFGWSTINLIMLPLLIISALLTTSWMLADRARPDSRAAR